VVKVDAIAAQLQSNVVNPFIANLKKRSEETLDGTISTIDQTSQQIINEALQREEERYRRELGKKPAGSSPVPPKVALCATMSTLYDSMAAHFALSEIEQMSTRRNDNATSVLAGRRRS
jgi:hypothetical protein